MTMEDRKIHPGKLFFLLLFVLTASAGWAQYLLIPMDEESQKNHLKAYGIAYTTLEKDVDIEWLLNYRGGSFLIPEYEGLRTECRVRNVSFETLSSAQAQQIRKTISSPAVNKNIVKLQVAPEIAVYSPKGKQPWDDAVTLVLTYAEIPYDIVYDKEVLDDLLPKYDWLHLHHEDFTGQYGKFYAAFRNAPWYIRNKKEAEADAKAMGFDKVSEQKLAVAQKIKEFTTGGGFLFAMCSATDSYDIALSAAGVDICEPMFDGDPAEPNYQNKLDYSRKTLPNTSLAILT